MSKRACLSDMKAFHEILKKSKNVVVLTGAGVSAESGIPTFRGAGGFWRTYQATDLASPSAFKRDPSLVWEFYHYRREVVMAASPNNVMCDFIHEPHYCLYNITCQNFFILQAHKALAEAECRLTQNGKKFNIITQNVDGLHARAGSKNIIELHGSLMKTRCLKCGEVCENLDSPICESLRGRG